MLYCASRGRHTYPKRLWQSSVCASDLDYIALSMGEVAPATAGFQPWIRLVSPTGVLLGNGIGTSAVQIAATAPTSGTYTVIVGTNEDRKSTRLNSSHVSMSYAANCPDTLAT